MILIESHFSIYAQWAGSFIIFLSCLPLFKSREPYVKVLLFYSLTSILFQLGQQISLVFPKTLDINQVGNGFVFFEAFFFSLIFLIASESRRWKFFFITLYSFYLIGYIVAFLFFTENMYSLIRTGRDLLMILNSIIFFYYLLRNLPEEDLLKYPMFWINASVIFFFSGTFVLSFLIGYVHVHFKEFSGTFWAFRNFFRVAFCLALAYACWLDWRIAKAKAVTHP